MDYVINDFLDIDECNSFIKHANKVGKKFNYYLGETWDCKRILDLEFNNLILDTFIKKYNQHKFKLWFSLDDFEIKDVNVSMTTYQNGEGLDLHLDLKSQLTTVIVLNDNFLDGRFMLSEVKDKNSCEKHFIKMGQSISFDGTKLYHGVLPVTTGVRYALNIWMTNTDYKFNKSSII
jgi:predicted 2-oxoglutarate/Fe(II)-dependent dioxygenase YbiX